MSRMDYDTFMKVSNADIETIKKNENFDYTQKEPIYGQTVFHMLLRNYVALLASAEPKNKDWLAKLSRFENAISLILLYCNSNKQALLSSQNNKGETPFRAMVNWCPVFSNSELSKEEENAANSVIKTAGQLLKAQSDVDQKDKDSLRELKQRLYS